MELLEDGTFKLGAKEAQYIITRYINPQYKKLKQRKKAARSYEKQIQEAADRITALTKNMKTWLAQPNDSHEARSSIRVILTSIERRLDYLEFYLDKAACPNEEYEQWEKVVNMYNLLLKNRRITDDGSLAVSEMSE